MRRDAAWNDKLAVDPKLQAPVERILPDEQCAIAGGTSYPYDALLIATGGRPNRSDAPGAGGAANVFNFQFLDDTKAISEQLERSKTAVAVGGSFIAYELAEAFAQYMRERSTLRVERPAPTMGGEDFAYFAQRVPGLLVRLGIRSEAKGCTFPGHSAQFRMDEDALPAGVETLVNFAVALGSGGIHPQAIVD